METKSTKRSHCPISLALDIFGDKWTLLIVRDLVFADKKTYGEFLKSEEKIATNILASRLRALEEASIITRTQSPEDKRRELYSLTEKGKDLTPILIEMALWSAKHDTTCVVSDDILKKTKEIKRAL